MSAPVDLSVAARMRGLRDSAIRTQDPCLPFKIDLRRAMHASGPPGRIDFGLGGNAEDALVARGWGDPTPDGRWTLGPIAQLLIVTETPLRGQVSLTIEIAKTYVAARHPLQTMALEVNGVAIGERRFTHGATFQPEWAVVVPAAVVERLGALLVDFRLAFPIQPLELGLDDDFRLLGVMIRAIALANVPLDPSGGRVTAV